MAGFAVNIAVIRTGKILLTRLNGIYSWLGNWFPGYRVLFAARPIGGEIKCQEGETIDVKWFAIDGVPSPLSAAQKGRIENAISGVTGVSVLQEFEIQAIPEN